MAVNLRFLYYNIEAIVTFLTKTCPPIEVCATFRGREMNTNFLTQTFEHFQGSGSGTSRQNSRDIPVSLPRTQGQQTFEGGHELFDPHPLAWKTPAPHSGPRAIVAHVCGDPLSRYTCRATRVAADFLRIVGFFRCSSSIALHPP